MLSTYLNFSQHSGKWQHCTGIVFGTAKNVKSHVATLRDNIYLVAFKKCLRKCLMVRLFRRWLVIENPAQKRVTCWKIIPDKRAPHTKE